MELKSRIQWVDTMRGLAVILVILHHTGLVFIGRFILAFHMPVFFFISGYLYGKNQSYHQTIGAYTKKYFWHLMIPYVFFASFSWLISYVIMPMIMHTFSANSSMEEFIHILIYWTQYWFIPCMFVSCVIVHLIEAVFYRCKHRALSMWGGY